ncbi:ATP-dependent DNA helicase [Virgibacillus halodenitrificans]|uniref:ATP-dependent DNA helicase n=1 Tax=Virgibacillus halodenitrificans TaxID=1482 RepID=UPI000EF52282|nr:AAA family ATPase [Virgibacillus halodenitrificans]
METKNIVLNKKQNYLVQEGIKWYKDPTDQVFAYCGFAGTGKTFTIHYLISAIQEIDKSLIYDNIAFCSFTGKASLVMTQKSNGKYRASTIHHLIYQLDNSGKNPQFVLKSKEELKSLYKLIVVDEASMVDGKTERDLKSFGIPIIAIGDKGQLEPISNSKDDRGTLLDKPVVELTEIHRQAEDNPIIYLSMLAREGKQIKPGKYGDRVYVLNKRDLSLEKKLTIYQRADQVICGYNKTKNMVNQRIRQNIGFQTPFPEVNDKLICTKNNWGKEINDINLVNGLTGFARTVEKEAKKDETIKRDAMLIDFQPDFMEETFDSLYLLHSDFSDEKIKLEREEYSVYDKFDFGYAITCHKSQGSSWGNVVLVNEVLNSASHKRWLYTGITRAEENLIIFV